MKEVLYSSWIHFVGMEGIGYASIDLIEKAREFLEKNSTKIYVRGGNVNYEFDDCRIKDLNNLGLKILSEDKSKIKSIASILFEDNVSRA
ncbi:MAG: hypothetical protein AABX93_03685 [Nanoarchaeota archaeon]